MPPRPRYIDSLTPLRGIAALWVVAFHFDAMVGPLVPRAASQIIARGYLLVDFFFVLSGFVISHVYGAWFASGLTRTTWRARWRAYTEARLSRLYPLHLFCLLLMVALSLALHLALPQVTRSVLFRNTFDAWAIPTHLAMGHAMGLHRALTWNHPSWSIAAEWWTYQVAVLLFPLLLGGKRRWLVWAAAGASLALLYALAQDHGRGALDITYRHGFRRCLLEFIVGMALYRAYAAGALAAWLGHDASFAAAALLAAGLMHAPVHDVLLVPVFALLILSAAHNQGRVRQVLALRPLRVLGDISYSVYMIHYIWVFVCWMFFSPQLQRAAAQGHEWPARYLAFFIVTALVLASALLTYRFIERPARAWLRKAANEPRSSTARAPG